MNDGSTACFYELERAHRPEKDHFGCMDYHPPSVSNQYGDSGCRPLRAGHAHGTGETLAAMALVIGRYGERLIDFDVRADAAFAGWNTWAGSTCRMGSGWDLPLGPEATVPIEGDVRLYLPPVYLLADFRIGVSTQSIRR